MTVQTWATLVKLAGGLAILLAVVVPLMVWVERRGMALAQDRRGPNRVGPLGLVQPLADAFKFFFKEDIIPTAADRVMYLLGPTLALVPAMTTFMVVPFGPDITIAGQTIPLVVVDGEAGILLFLALASLGVYSLVTAGYASNNKYSQIGAIRASAQLISYELALGVAILGVLLPAGSFRLADVITYQQEHLWNFLLQPLGFLVFFVAMFAETNRLPFDLPEAESELVAGYHTEYSAMKFALFFMSEYANMTTLSAVLATLYFGGWTLPGIPAPAGFAGAVFGIAVLGLKVALMMWVFVWVRFSFPRFRYDQLMRLGWKALLPLAFFNLLLVAVLTLAGWL